jgi:hypothetical protein
MAHFLDLEQLTEEAHAQGLDIEHHLEKIERATNDIALMIVQKRRDIEITDNAEMAPGFGGLCVGFGPANDGDKCPDDFIHYDPRSPWAEEV